MRIVFSFFFLLMGLISVSGQNSQPVPFLPEIFRQLPNVRDFSMSAKGNEIYFTVESYKKDFSAILFIRKTSNGWTQPEVVPFSGQYRDLEPFLSSDNLALYFVSTRPTSDSSSAKKDADIWMIKRATLQSAWSAPVHLDAPVNSDKDEYYPAVARNGNIYFTRESNDPERNEDIFRSVFIIGKYTEPVALSDSVNSPTYEFNAYVSPDENYILFSSYGRPDDAGGSDLYICKKNANGEWTAARNLGKTINSNKIDYCPFPDLKNNILYFTSERNTLPHQYKSKQSWKQLKQHINQYSNGLSRIYCVPFDVKTNP